MTVDLPESSELGTIFFSFLLAFPTIYAQCTLKCLARNLSTRELAPVFVFKINFI